MSFQGKYLKYKSKYLNLKASNNFQIGGMKETSCNNRVDCFKFITTIIIINSSIVRNFLQ